MEPVHEGERTEDRRQREQADENVICPGLHNATS
jgi:hypothetical protein